MKQHIFLRGEYLGSREIPPWVSLGESPKPTNSYVLFCPMCADIWGKLMCDGAYCQVVTSHCAEHAIFPSDATFISNSHWEGDPRGMDGAEWPRAVLLHDVANLANFFLNHKDRFPYEQR